MISIRLIIREIVVKIFESEINLEDCFFLLGCSVFDDLESIRKKFFYKLSYLIAYTDSIYEYYHEKSLVENEVFAEKDRRRELELNAQNIKLVCDSYLAILLYQLKDPSYTCIISGLCEYLKIESINEKRYSSFLESQLENNCEEVVISQMENYFNELELYNHFSTGAGVYLSTSSLRIIIEIEKKRMVPSESVKCLIYREEPKYGTGVLERKIFED